MGSATILRADARALPLADASVDLIVTSPPYFALRSYTDGGEHYADQIGAEATPQEYIAALIDCTREWVRVLKPGGSIWVNLGDKYAGRASGPRALPGRPKTSSQWNAGRGAEKATGVPDKSLMMLPERYRIACVDELGLIARAVVIWNKPNGLPESVRDRVRRSHEDWVHLTKAPHYFSSVDAIREPHAYPDDDRSKRRSGYSSEMTGHINGGPNPLGKLPGSVWSIATQPLKVPAELGIDHFAAFPMEWPRRIILGWSPVGGVVLDPFGGTGTTAAVAKALGRAGISIDASADYCRLAVWRTTDAKQIERAGRAAVSRTPVLDASGTNGYADRMAADKKIMAQIETLRLDRPGRTWRATQDIRNDANTLGAALTELAATYREEAELWAKSGAKGWKGSEAEKYLVAQHIDDVAAQLDNAGGGAALSVSQTEPATTHERLDDLVSAAVAEGRGLLRKTAYEWNDDPSVDPFVVSWSDFGNSAHALGMTFGKDDPITRAEFERARDGGAVTVGHRVKAEIGPTATGETHDVAAYLKGEVDTLPGLTEALVPSSVTSAPEADNPFAEQARAKIATLPDFCTMCDTDMHRCHGCGEPVEHGKYACAQCELIHADGPPFASAEDIADAGLVLDPNGSEHGPDDRNYSKLPKTWETDTMTADGHLLPGVAKATAPPLGQPGDMGAGYSHDYVPPGGRRLTFADLLTPVPMASLPAHVSNSQVGTVGDCAAKYRMQRVEGLPQIPQWANIGGTAFHAAVEAFERTMAKLQASRDVTFQDYDTELIWKHHFEAEINRVQATTTVPISSWRSSRKGAEGRQWWEVNGPQMLRRYLDARPAAHTALIGADGALAIELELTVDVPTPYGPVPFVAKLDRVTLYAWQDGQNPGLMIRDYKTSYERPTDTTQLGDYAHVLLLNGLNPAVRIFGSYFDARRGEWTEPVDLLAAHPFEAFQYRVTSAHAQKHALTTGPTPARPSSYCGGCSVRYACPVMASRP